MCARARGVVSITATTVYATSVYVLCVQERVAGKHAVHPRRDNDNCGAELSRGACELALGPSCVCKNPSTFLNLSSSRPHALVA
jgi:hypothetical protein